MEVLLNYAIITCIKVAFWENKPLKIIPFNQLHCMWHSRPGGRGHVLQLGGRGKKNTTKPHVTVSVQICLSLLFREIPIVLITIIMNSRWQASLPISSPNTYLTHLIKSNIIGGNQATLKGRKNYFKEYTTRRTPVETMPQIKYWWLQFHQSWLKSSK